MIVSVIFPRGSFSLVFLIWLWAHETHLYVCMLLALQSWLTCRMSGPYLGHYHLAYGVGRIDRLYRKAPLGKERNRYL